MERFSLIPPYLGGVEVSLQQSASSHIILEYCRVQVMEYCRVQVMECSMFGGCWSTVLQDSCFVECGAYLQQRINRSKWYSKNHTYWRCPRLGTEDLFGTVEAERGFRPDWRWKPSILGALEGLASRGALRLGSEPDLPFFGNSQRSRRKFAKKAEAESK